MAVTMKELIQDEYMMQNFRLLAGKAGLGARIMWFYIATDATTDGTMPGPGELLFLPHTFLDLPILKQIGYLDTCRKRRVPGMVILGTLPVREKLGGCAGLCRTDLVPGVLRRESL